MAWFDGFSSLKGQLSNLAKGVLNDEGEEDAAQRSSDDLKQDGVPGPSEGSQGSNWNDTFPDADTFIGQDVSASSGANASVPANIQQPETSSSKIPQDEDSSVLSKGLASLLSIGKSPDVSDELKALQAENKALREENEAKSRDIRSYTRIISELESMVAVSQDENSNLSTGMEELDIQHQQAIEQVITVKEDTMKQYEQLQLRYAELESNYLELKKINDQPKPKTINTASGPMVYVEDNSKQYLISELEERDKDIEMLENEILQLNEVINDLKSDLNNAKDPPLPPIPENTEDMDLKISALEGDVSVLREVRTNLETEVSTGRERIAGLTRRVNDLNAMLKNQENVVTDWRLLTEKHAQQEQEIAHNRSYIEKLHSDLEKSRNEHSAAANSLKKELEDKKAYIDRLEEGSEASNQFLQEENAKLNEKIVSLVHQTHALDEKLERAQIDNESKDKKLCELVFELNGLKEECKAFKEKYDLERDQYESQLKALTDARQSTEAAEEMEKAMTSTLEELKDKIRTLELELQSTKSNEELLRVEILALTETRDNLKKKLTESENLEQLIEQQNSTIEELNQENEKLRSSWKEDKRSWEQEIDSLRNSINEFQINKDLSRETILELKKQLEEKEDELFKQNETYLGKLSHLEAEIGEKTKDNSTLNGKIAELESSLANAPCDDGQLNDLRSQLTSVQEINAQLTKDAKKLTNEIELHKMTENQVEVLVARNKEYVAKLEEEDEKMRSLQNENDELRRSLELKHAESVGYSGEIQSLNNALHTESAKLEQLTQNNANLTNAYAKLQCQSQEKLTLYENMEIEKNKQISTLNQEVESLKNQLEYVSQLLKSVERGEGEGQGETPPNQKICDNGCSETQEELKRLTTVLAKGQTENKLLKKKVEEMTEKLNKDGTQLATFREHLVQVEEGYSKDLLSAQMRINELTGQLAEADNRVRASSTVYTSANIRANQQVESLTQQVKLLTEHKEKLETELSIAEDNYQKQCAAITNLQVVLNQFQRDKECDIQFETERIRQKLNVSNAKNIELQQEIEQLRDQLLETNKGLAAATRLTDQLDSKMQLIESLNQQVDELATKLKTEEDKVKAAYMNVEGKVDRNLLKNLLVGYVCSPPNSKTQVLKVIAQVLDLTREERIKLGLEPGTTAQHQSLSEAFIRFLESESQPKPIVPLSQPNSTPPSRKSSQSGPGGSLLLPSEELPSIPHFTVGRNSSGSILKDVLKDRTN